MVFFPPDFMSIFLLFNNFVYPYIFYSYIFSIEDSKHGLNVFFRVFGSEPSGSDTPAVDKKEEIREKAFKKG